MSTDNKAQGAIALLRELREWGETLGGWEADVWRRTADFLASLEPEAEQPKTLRTWKVQKSHDAWVTYEATVEATSAEEAADIAHEGGVMEWDLGDTQTFDAYRLVVLDEDGEEIEGTARGKLA
jgi:hypothetical protein